MKKAFYLMILCVSILVIHTNDVYGQSSFSNERDRIIRQQNAHAKVKREKQQEEFYKYQQSKMENFPEGSDMYVFRQMQAQEKKASLKKTGAKTSKKTKKK